MATRLRESWLADRPGALTRTAAWWEVRLHDPESWRDGASAYRFVLHFAGDGQPDGYAYFRVKDGGPHGGAEVTVADLDAATPPAYAALWRFLLNLDLVRSFRRDDAPADEPLRLLVADPRAITTETIDGTYARIVDVPAALGARRYAAEVDMVLRGDGCPAAAERQGVPAAGRAGRSRGRTDLGPAGCPSRHPRAGRALPGRSLTGHAAAGRPDHRGHAGFAHTDGRGLRRDRLPYCNDYF